MRQDGVVSEAVNAQVRRVASLGHEVTLATGRSASGTLPVLDRFGLTPHYVVCSNGAITLRRDESAPTGYVRDHVETFDPASVLTTIRSHLGGAHFAVEDEAGFFRYTGTFPDLTIGLNSQRVEFDDLLHGQATRVVVVSPDHGTEEFLQVVERMGLHRVSYAIGWTAWLDIASDGVNKAAALERVRSTLDIPRDRVLAIGDGRNDVDMLEWAAEFGRGVAMGHAPLDVIAAGNETTASVAEDGAARTLESLFG
jgi:hydroxymethylpyrimidine pyrophosphatase-like HAD family hydrolase